jgi:CRP-like cAMP-binding protein
LIFYLSLFPNIKNTSVLNNLYTRYGDYSPANSSEQIFGIIYMLTNMAIGAWIIGSITLLMLKKDEATSQFRDALHSLDQYSKMHGFERRFRKRLLSQAKLFFKHQQISDEEILRNLPLSVRRKVLRRLYLPSLLQTSLLKGLRQQFVDSILISCTVEIFNAGEEILARGHASNDLYLVVEGHVKVMDAFSQDTDEKKSDDNAPFDDTSFHNTSIADDDTAALGIKGFRKLGPGHFINDVSFLTETPSTSTVRTLTVCKTLTLCQSSYKKIAQEHPGSVEKVLRNLLQKAEEVAEEVGENDICLAKRLMVLKSESIRDFKRSKQDDDNENDDADADVTDLHKCVASIQAKAAVVACKDLIKIHIEKMHDDHTTRFLFAAARGNSVTIAMMCDQGLDPNVADYDRRTALMVASMKGNVDAVKKLLEYDADPNLADASGTTALMEATTNGHEHIMDMLMEHGATLGLNASCAAGRMCQAVFDGDMVTLRRLLKAKINPDAGDYDKRTGKILPIVAFSFLFVCPKILTI